MSIISLNSRERYLPMDESQEILRKLHLDHHTLASDATANSFLRKGLNGPSGIRYVDASGIFKHVRRALGSSAARTFSLCGPSQSFFDCIADCVNYGLERYATGRMDHGVLVFRQERHADGYGLVPVTGKDALFGRVVHNSNATLLIPTGMTAAPYTGCKDVFLRIDVARPRFRGAYFKAEEFIFSDGNGRSIAGLGDIPDYIVNLDDVNDALKGALGDDYDPHGVNATVFDAWWSHKLTNPLGQIIHAPLRNREGEDTGFTMVLKRTTPTAWEVFLDDGEDERPLSFFLPDTEICIDPDDILSELDSVKAALESTDDLISITNFNHIFDDNFARFPEAFRKSFDEDQEEGVETFIEALELAKAQPSKWMPIPYHEGHERFLVYNGDEEFSRIQLLLPLLLTDDEKRQGMASVFAVVGLRRDPSTGEVSCIIPTILERSTAYGNICSLRKMGRKRRLPLVA